MNGTVQAEIDGADRSEYFGCTRANAASTLPCLFSEVTKEVRTMKIYTGLMIGIFSVSSSAIAGAANGAGTEAAAATFASHTVLAQNLETADRNDQRTADANDRHNRDVNDRHDANANDRHDGDRHDRDDRDANDRHDRDMHDRHDRDANDRHDRDMQDRRG
jgi:hypothetical protein